MAAPFTSPDAAPSPAAPMLTLERVLDDATPEVIDILTRSDALQLALSIAVVERTTKLDKFTLINIGMGVGSGSLLHEETGSARVERRNEIVLALMSKDENLKTIGEPDDIASAVVMVGRKLVTLMAEANREPLAALVSAPTGGNTVTFVEREEDRANRDETLEAGEIDRLGQVLEKMYNYKLRPTFQLSTSQTKKVGYWPRKQGTWANPVFLPVSTFAKTGESMYVAMKKYVLNMWLTAAGMPVPVGQRDEGAGAVKGFAPQWLSGRVVVEFLGELEEAREKLAGRDLDRLIPMVCLSLYKASAEGGCSGSLALSQQIVSMADKVSWMQLSAPQPNANPTKSPKAPKAKAAGDKRKKPLAASPAAGPGAQKWPDTEGVNGPNGLPRRRGGNPAGVACTRHARGNCTFNFCSFSHGAPAAAAE